MSDTNGSSLKPARLAALVAILLAAVIAYPYLAPRPIPKSLLLITIDTLRADHLSAYGHSGPTSPNLDAFMKKGTRFRWAFSTSSYTGPSHSSLMTGYYPSSDYGLHGVRRQPFPESPMLAEYCKANKMITAAIISNPLLSPDLGGPTPGFDIYDDNLPDRDLNRNMPEQHAEDAVDKALELLQKVGSKPFFIWLHLQDPHGPYVPPSTAPQTVTELTTQVPYRLPETLPIGPDHSGYRAIPTYQELPNAPDPSEYVQRYNQEIRYMDHHLGRLFSHLENADISDDVLTVITSDHGEAMGEREFYFAHSQTVAPDQTRVPLAFVGPGIEQDQVVDQSVSTVDVYATILDLLYMKPPEEVPSRSLADTLLDGTPPAPRPFFVESYGHVGAILGDSMLHLDRYPPGEKQVWDQPNPNSGGYFKPLGPQWFELRDTGAAEVEAGDVERASDLRKALQEFRQRMATARSEGDESAEEELSEKEKSVLRSLGYMQ